MKAATERMETEKHWIVKTRLLIYGGQGNNEENGTSRREDVWCRRRAGQITVRLSKLVGKLAIHNDT